MNINDNFIKSFFKLCVKLYNYNNDNRNIEIKDLSEFIEKCNKKISIIEDNEILNNQLLEQTKEINNLISKIKEYENKYGMMYIELSNQKKTIKNNREEINDYKKRIEELYNIKVDHEKEIELYKQMILKYKKKHNDNKNKNELLYKKLKETEETLIGMKYDFENVALKKEELEEKNKKFIEEIKKIEKLKNIVSNKLSSESIEHLDISIIEAIEKANVYAKKNDEVNLNYNNLLLNQTNETNDLKKQIKVLIDKMQDDRQTFNENMVLIETKNQIKNENKDNIKYFDIRDKKAIEFFNKDIKIFNEKNKRNNIINDNNNNKYTNISYSTDYMVDLLKMSDKVNINIKDLNIEDENVSKKNKDIFLQQQILDSNVDHIDSFEIKQHIIKDTQNLKILNSDEDDQNHDEIQLKNELNEFIKKNENNIFIGGNRKNKLEIKLIDNMYKMNFGNDYSTLTEQNINLNDEKIIKKIRHRKYMRNIREKNKLKYLQDDIL